MGENGVRVLAFDCSTVQGSLAVVEEGGTIFAEGFECPRGRGGEFFEVLDHAIRKYGRPDRIAVGIGPGSYNGLRTAIAAAEGLRLATGAEVMGIASVRVLACDAQEYVAVNDARGGVFYFVRVRRRGIVGEFELLSAEALADRLAREPDLPVFASSPVAAIPRARVAFPDAIVLAELARSGQADAGALEPLYLKPAHITPSKRTGLLPRGK